MSQQQTKAIVDIYTIKVQSEQNMNYYSKSWSCKVEAI